jgi:hypothetical protein
MKRVKLERLSHPKKKKKEKGPGFEPWHYIQSTAAKLLPYLGLGSSKAAPLSLRATTIFMSVKT